MTKTKQRSDIETLLADRARYEAWLEQLAAKSSQVPANVVQRVRGDYEERLTQVVEELKSRADELKSESDALAARIDVLDVDLSAKRDARAEDELRAMVGEFDSDVWDAKRGEHDRGIGGLETERAEREGDLTKVRGLLSEATRPTRVLRVEDIPIPEEPTPVEPTVASAPDLSADVSGAFRKIDDMSAAPPPAPDARTSSSAAVQPPSPAEAVPGAQVDPSAPRPPSPFDELAFLKTVVGRPTPHAGVLQIPPAPGAPSTAVPGAPAPPTAVPSPRISQVPPLPPPPITAPAPEQAAPRSPPVATASAPPAPNSPALAQPTVSATARRPSIPSFEPPPLPDASASAPARAATPSMPTFELPRDASVGQPTPARGSAGASLEGSRSLKCQECGWMNFPTEWYCEKCGGELAAF